MTKPVLTKDEETIVAQCTPQGAGAIAMLRVCGVNAISIVDACAQVTGGQTLQTAQTHTIHYGWVTDAQGNKIDQVLFLLMRGPKTFTGQDTVEITGHNNQFLVERIIQRLLDCDARIAQAGEFTRRAYLNNKIDLIQAEAINELIGSQTEHALKQSLSQLEGSFSSLVSQIEKKLVHAMALSEASFEFIDEDVQFGPQISALVTQTLDSIAGIKSSHSQQDQIRQGVRIALIGSVNTGKSSLFNALTGKKRAIVTNIAGTTRDCIEAGLNKYGNFWTLVDTAGLRSTDDIIEAEGIKKSLEQAELSDIILLIFDGSRPLSVSEHDAYKTILDRHAKKCLIIRTKKDLPQVPLTLIDDQYPVLTVSSQTQENVQLLESEIQRTIEHLFTSLGSAYLLTKRHYHLLITLEKSLISIIDLCRDQIQYELLSFHLQDAIATVSELTGKSISEAAMDAVFREFCVGK